MTGGPVLFKPLISKTRCFLLKCVVSSCQNLPAVQGFREQAADAFESGKGLKKKSIFLDVYIITETNLACSFQNIDNFSRVARWCGG